MGAPVALPGAAHSWSIPEIMNQLRYTPNMVRKFDFHRQRDAQRLMDPTEVVEGEVQRSLP